MFGLGKQHKVVEAVPHPELIPLTEEECRVNVDIARLHTSRRDYSSEEIKAAFASGYVPGDILEFCHTNGIDWQVQMRKRGKQ